MLGFLHIYGETNNDMAQSKKQNSHQRFGLCPIACRLTKIWPERSPSLSAKHAALSVDPMPPQ